MPVFVIDDDGPTRAAHEALRRRGGRGTMTAGPRLTADGAIQYDAMVADVCMLDLESAAKVRALMQHRPETLLVAMSRDGAVAPVNEAPNFGAMAGLLVGK